MGSRMLCPETNSFQLSKLSAASSPATSSTKLPSPSPRGVKRHLLDLGGDVARNGLSKLFLTIAATFAEAERDRISQKARGRFLGGSVQFGLLSIYFCFRRHSGVGRTCNWFDPVDE
jgi:hypothetical protein